MAAIKIQVLLFSIVGLAVAQQHDGSALGVVCGQTICASNQVCAVDYGKNEPALTCQPIWHCQHEVANAIHRCPNGGALVHGWCQVCCTDQACITDTLNNAGGFDITQAIQYFAVNCPAVCTPDQSGQCQGTGTTCPHNQYCHLRSNALTGNLYGVCKDQSDYPHCKAAVTAKHCDVPLHTCDVGCCGDDACVAEVFAASKSSMHVVAQGGCKDTLENNECAILVGQSQEQCADDTTVRLCPESCGLCRTYDSSSCKDVISRTQCTNLARSEDICNKPLGLTVCPVTCGKCHDILEGKILEVLNAHTTTRAPNPVRCKDLTDLSCSVLEAVCPTVDCPGKCNKCDKLKSKPDATLPLATAAVLSHTPTAAPTTTTAAPATTTIEPTTSTSAPVCQDTLEGLNCGDIKDACSNSMLSGLCQKFCGICGGSTTTTALPTPVPTTTVTLPVTTPAPTTPAPATAVVGTTSGCHDTLEGLNCADVKDSCVSPLLANYCQKSCGVCV